MANINAPFGFRPYQQILRIAPYYTTNASCIGEGSVVAANAAGFIHQITFTGIVADASQTGKLGSVIGVAAHFVSSAAAGTQRKVLVYDHPQQLYMVQATAAIARSAFFSNFMLTRTNDGKNASVNRTTGSSKTILANQASVTPSGFFRVTNWANHIDQVTTAANAKVVGYFNPRWLRSSSVTGT